MTEYSRGYIAGALSAILIFMLLFVAKPCKAQDIVYYNPELGITTNDTTKFQIYYKKDTSAIDVLVTKCRGCFAVPETIYLIPGSKVKWYWKRTGFFGRKKFVKVPNTWMFWTKNVYFYP